VPEASKGLRDCLEGGGGGFVALELLWEPPKLTKRRNEAFKAPRK